MGLCLFFINEYCKPLINDRLPKINVMYIFWKNENVTSALKIRVMKSGQCFSMVWWMDIKEIG